MHEFVEINDLEESLFNKFVPPDLRESFRKFNEGVTARSEGGGLKAFYSWQNSPSADHDWLSRYWRNLLEQRPDVVEAFPDLESWDRRAFLNWATETLKVEGSNPLIARPAKSALGMRWHPSKNPDDPVDLQIVGYLRRESSLGFVARRLVDESTSLVPRVGMLAYDRTRSTRLDWSPREPGEWRRAQSGAVINSSVVVVNSDQFAYLLADLPMLRRESESLIGYWAWELETPPRDSERFDHILDEIWVNSRYVQRAVKAGTSLPVRYVPLPLGVPETSSATRSDFGIDEDSFVFLTTFDFYSLRERKNPEGSIAAFKEAFPTPSRDVSLVIKTMHASERQDEMAQLKALCERRPDIMFIDDVLYRNDHHRLLELSDCLVSLHRSEGFGLQLAEAMHLGTPVIATRYSGNLDFMDDESSLLVDFTKSCPPSTQFHYPTDSSWAEPDVKHAAEYMFQIASDNKLQQRLSQSGKARIEKFDEMARTLAKHHISRVLRKNAL